MGQDWQSVIMEVIRSQPIKPDLDEQDIQRLNRIPVDVSAKFLRELFENESDRFMKSRYFSALLCLADFDKVGFLIEIMKKASVDWRIVCCEMLGNYFDERAVESLCKAVIKDKNPDVRYAAVEALGKIGDFGAVSTLNKVQQNDKGRDYEGFLISEAAADAISAILHRLRSSPTSV